MSERKLVQSWLEILCQMIPGISQAILLVDSFPETDSQIQWPTSGVMNDELVKAARLAARQDKMVNSTLSPVTGNDAEVDTIIALSLAKKNNFTGTLSILVKVKPSQQKVVMQILYWGEMWLQLLMQQQTPEQLANVSTDDPPEPAKGFSIFQLSHRHLVIAGLLLAGAVMATMTGTYRVTSPASLEGRVQRVIVAPFDGFIASTAARAGDKVTVGDVIAELDSRELLLQKQQYAAQKNEYSRQYRQALVERKITQAHIFKSQVSQAEAQLRLLENKIQRSTLRAPLDGLIISGDLSRSLGAPVQVGEVLFEVAPLDEYRLVIFVDERQVVDVQANMQGVLNLKALPATDLAFAVQKVSPVFEENTDGISYRVEARLDIIHPALRPGMQGVAKIDIGQRSYLWIYLHELYDAIRLWLWSMLP